jgi:hypothetical protein
MCYGPRRGHRNNSIWDQRPGEPTTPPKREPLLHDALRSILTTNGHASQAERRLRARTIIYESLLPSVPQAIIAMRIAEDPLLDKLPTDLRLVVESRDHAKCIIDDSMLAHCENTADVSAADREAAVHRLGREPRDARSKDARRGIRLQYAKTRKRLNEQLPRSFGRHLRHQRI